MAKEYYDVSYKTYFNDRIKPTVFQGKAIYPLYVQVTYDRKSLFFKSYYFDLFARSKFDFLQTTIPQIEKLEMGVIDYIVTRHFEAFDLRLLPRRYKLFSQDVLSGFEGFFKLWLANYLEKEGFPGLAVLVEYAPDEVCVIRVWDDLKKILDPEIFEEMEYRAVKAGPYLPLALYVRHQSPQGPFCLPLHEWLVKERSIEIESFIDERFSLVDFGPVIRAVKLLFYPNGLRSGI